MRLIACAVAGLLTLCAALAGQQTLAATVDSTTVIPRWHVGGAVDAGQPVEDLKEQVNNALGLLAHFLLRLDARGNTGLPLQGGWLNCGHERQQDTTNNIFSLGVGPEFSVALAAFRLCGGGGIHVSINNLSAPDLFTIRIGFSTGMAWGTRGSTP